MKKYLIIIIQFLFLINISAQTMQELLFGVRANLDKVNDYEAKGKLKTNVVFLKTPVANVKVFYKKPDKLKIVNEGGISFIPKGSVNINLYKFLVKSENFEAIDAGREDITGLRILKLLPKDENSEIVLSTLYIDEKSKVIKKAKNTTRDNGTYELEMFYGHYISLGLPDKIIFSFNTKDYKLPKGVTFDYDDGSKKKMDENLKKRKGEIEIIYSTYRINKGIDDSVFN